LGSDFIPRLLAGQPPLAAKSSKRLNASTSISARRWGQAAWAGLASALLAACLVAVFAWPGPNVNKPVPIAPNPDLAHQRIVQPPIEFANIPAWPGAGLLLDEAKPPTFDWPVLESSPLTVSTSIPADLLN
jgi:hypothetical protein